MTELTLVQKLTQELRTRTIDPSSENISDPALLEAELILESAVERIDGSLPSRLDLHSVSKWSPQVEDLANAWVSRRLKGEPIQLITERCQFLEHRYWVTPQTLIPRPETEFLVETALTRLRNPVRGLELGIGTGVISVEIMIRFSNLKMIATEISPGAISCAEKNAASLIGEESARERLQIVRSEEPETVFPQRVSDTDAPFDFLISNPPYLSPDDEISEETRRFEPKAALFPASKNSSYFYDCIAQTGKRVLKPDALVFLEIPHERAPEIGLLFSSRKWRDIEILNDLTGRPRVLIARRPSDSREDSHG